MDTKKTDDGPPVKIEIISGEFGVFNGAIFIDDKCAGHVQFNSGLKPKRTRNIVRRLRELGIEVVFPNYVRE